MEENEIIKRDKTTIGDLPQTIIQYICRLLTSGESDFRKCFQLIVALHSMCKLFLQTLELFSAVIPSRIKQ